MTPARAGGRQRQYTRDEVRSVPATTGSVERHESRSLDGRKLQALAEIGSIVVSADDFEQVLAAVIEKVARLLGARGGGVMLYDPEAGTLVTQEPAFGLSPELVREYRVSLSDGGNAASVFVTGKGYFTNDARHDPRVIRRFAVRHAITRLLTVPLRLEGQSIGVFHAIDKVGGDFDSEDLELMTAIAPQLAVLVHSATVMRESRKHQRELERMLEVQEEFTEMLLRGEEVESLLARLSQLIGLPVLLLDPSGALAAGAEGAPDLAAHGAELGEIAADWAAGERLRTLALDEESALTAVRVQVRSEALGLLVAAHPAGAPSEDAIRALEQASVLFALEIVRARELETIRSRLEGDIVEHLLGATDADEVAGLLRRLGVPAASGYRCALLEMSTAESETTLSPQFKTRLSRLQRELRLRLAQESLPAQVVEHSRALWIILPVGEDPEAEDTALRRAIGSLPRAKADFVVGVGASGEGPLGLKESAEQARIAVSVGRRVGAPTPVLLYDELGVYRLLAQPAGGVEVRQYVDSVLGPLLEYDRDNDADWMAFLRTLVGTNFRVTNAAALAGCHINTAKYRLSRIEELLQRDLQSASDRFAIQLALEIRSLNEMLEA